MNPFRKFRDYFIGKALASTDDVFEKAKAEVLFNFTAFFLVTNTPYVIIASKYLVSLLLAVSVILALIIVLVLLRKTSNVRLATSFFLSNFVIQLGGHYILNNGHFGPQGTLFFLLFISCGFLLHDRKTGFIITIFVVILFVLGVYNESNNFPLFKCPPELHDPPETGAMSYFALIPMLLNIYLISEFVKARQKAERQIHHQKQLVEEKNEEILDSIRYAKHIQNALLPGEKYIDRILGRMRKR
jgi:hypothetical protein